MQGLSLHQFLPKQDIPHPLNKLKHQICEPFCISLQVPDMKVPEQLESPHSPIAEIHTFIF